MRSPARVTVELAMDDASVGVLKFAAALCGE